MGNYKDINSDFVDRTLRLINQYTAMIQELKYEEQFNYTLIMNCLLGLIVMPKERIVTFIPKVPIDQYFKNKIGLEKTTIDGSITDLKSLIVGLRHSIAHFDVEVISEDDNNRIDYIKFNGTGNQPETLARFYAPEILPFLQHYACVLTENYRAHGEKNS